MEKQIKIDDAIIDVNSLTDSQKEKFDLVVLSSERIKEMLDTLAVFKQAKNGYVANLKKEILASKSGLTFDE